MLCNRSHADAKYMPEDLTTNEVCECHYLWGKAFIDIDLTEEQNKKAHFISAWKTGRWNHSVKSFIRSMIHKHVGHYRLAVALWQRGLPLKALNTRVSGAAEHGSHDAAGRTHLDHPSSFCVDRIIIAPHNCESLSPLITHHQSSEIINSCYQFSSVTLNIINHQQQPSLIIREHHYILPRLSVVDKYSEAADIIEYKVKCGSLSPWTIRTWMQFSTDICYPAQVT